MWGFTDFAKAAQEQLDLAASAAAAVAGAGVGGSTITSSGSGSSSGGGVSVMVPGVTTSGLSFFNLDSIQQEEQDNQEQNQPYGSQAKMTRDTMSTKSTSFNNNEHFTGGASGGAIPPSLSTTKTGTIPLTLPRPVAPRPAGKKLIVPGSATVTPKKTSIVGFTSTVNATVQEVSPPTFSEAKTAELEPISHQSEKMEPELVKIHVIDGLGDIDTNKNGWEDEDDNLISFDNDDDRETYINVPKSTKTEEDRTPGDTATVADIFNSATNENHSSQYVVVDIKEETKELLHQPRLQTPSQAIEQQQEVVLNSKDKSIHMMENVIITKTSIADLASERIDALDLNLAVEQIDSTQMNPKLDVEAMAPVVQQKNCENEHAVYIDPIQSISDSSGKSPSSPPDDVTNNTSPIGNKKLLVLMSSTSMNRQVSNNQDHAFLALQAKKIDYETIDGADPNQRELRDELFGLSGFHGQYPQFFIVDLITGTSTFWGPYTRFEHANDDGLLTTEFAFDEIKKTDQEITKQALSTEENTESSAIQVQVPPPTTSDVMSAAELDPPPPDGQVAGNKNDTLAKESTKNIGLILESNDAGISAEENFPETETLPPKHSNSALMEQFSEQLKRLEENHQNNLDELKQLHSKELENLMDQNKHQINEIMQEHQEEQEKLKQELGAKDEQISQLCRRNEGHRLKMDVLKREVAGLQELLDARDRDCGQTNQQYSREVETLKSKLHSTEQAAGKAKEHAGLLQSSLDSARQEVTALKREQQEMKDRLKTVATELKERRHQCKDLHTVIEDLTEGNKKLQEEVTLLREQLTHQNVNRTEINEEVEHLKDLLAAKEREIVQIHKDAQDNLQQKEQTLLDYKKKAQHSLSMTNARIASAIQAKEEAELEARAARNTADSAFERAMTAENASRTAKAEADKLVKVMLREKEQALLDLQTLKTEHQNTQKELHDSKFLLEKAYEARDNKNQELERVSAELQKEKYTVAALQNDLLNASNQVTDLQNEISSLQSTLRSTMETIANNSANANGSNSTNMATSGSHDYNVYSKANGDILAEKRLSADEDDTMVISGLQNELRDANAIIEELRDALKNAVEELFKANNYNNNRQERVHNYDDDDDDDDDYNDGNHDADNRTMNRRSPDGIRGTSNNDSVGGVDANNNQQLFFAMEKQAELNTARAEIHRLSAMLADVQSGKMEAYEAMEDMRIRMEDAESRLQRFEKLNTAISNSTTSVGDGIGSSSKIQQQQLQQQQRLHLEGSQNGVTGTSSTTAASINIEYLKNILLRFMNAKSVTEKKALVPVIGAVLCLTTDELNTALTSVDQSASLSVVSKSLFEVWGGGATSGIR